MKRFFLMLLPILAVGCTCQMENLFRKAWDQHIQKTYNWVLADTEAAKYREEEDAARGYLQDLREADSLYVVAQRLQEDGFHWHRETTDFTSYPWVTIARKRGDCDDFMLLWESVVKYWDGESKRITVTSTAGGAHAMLFFYKDDLLFLLSNLRVLGAAKRGDEEDLIKLFYRDRTRCWIIY